VAKETTFIYLTSYLKYCLLPEWLLTPVCLGQRAWGKHFGKRFWKVKQFGIKISKKHHPLKNRFPSFFPGPPPEADTVKGEEGKLLSLFS